MKPPAPLKEKTSSDQQDTVPLPVYETSSPSHREDQQRLVEYNLLDYCRKGRTEDQCAPKREKIKYVFPFIGTRNLKEGRNKK